MRPAAKPPPVGRLYERTSWSWNKEESKRTVESRKRTWSNAATASLESIFPSLLTSRIF
jgi:hypothetical protein